MRFLVLPLLVFLTSPAFAQDSVVEDAFDPFADYSDFVEASTEETDINFFKYGRMLSLGVTMGYRGFTGGQADLYERDYAYGAFFTYYMSLQFAVQVSFITGANEMSFAVPERDFEFSANSRHQFYSLHGKYFINTQNLTKAISKFNPFVIGGFSRLDRETGDRSQPIVGAKDSTATFDLGLGIEYLFNNNKNFVTLQGMYHMTDFSDEGRNITILDPDRVETDITRDGDIIQFLLMVGFNF